VTLVAPSDPKKRKLPIIGGPPRTSEATSHDEKPRKRLPVIQEPPDDDEAQDRPAWHWAGIGMIAIFLVWLPLASLVNALIARSIRGVEASPDAPSAASPEAQVVMVASNALCFVIAAIAGGYLVGRFGGRAGRREAAASGASAAAIAWSIAIAGSVKEGYAVWFLLLLVMAVTGFGAAYVGGLVGLRGRRPRV